MRLSAPVRFGSIRARMPLAGRGQRIGLLGGSFNPPHAGHVAISETALRRLGLDWVWWLVTPGNPLKSHAELLPLAERLALSRRIARNPRIRMTALEAGLPTPFTTATVSHLRLRRPDIDFVWLMGADNLAQLHRWRQWRRLVSLVPFAVLDRPGWRLKALAAPAARRTAAARLPESAALRLAGRTPPAWVFVTTRLSPLSSTAIRAAAHSTSRNARRS